MIMSEHYICNNYDRQKNKGAKRKQKKNKITNQQLCENIKTSKIHNHDLSI